MDKDTFLEKIKEIGTLEDEVERRTALTDLTDSISSIFDTNSNLVEENNKYKEENNKYKEDNEKLRSANMQLFLKVGTGKTEQENKKEYEEEEKKPRKFEDLFNEKGEIK
jgi:hypothetical protein